ncbi:unnamed protein product [Cylindrotheca closterium]|uniref:Uncharacterized protein n=1 Tax=Cylindrotheca closterium TaxID=2856 RepID=A0AAD2G4B8_9STRA|nr:unnamed protein product [Cylindrotheca closterium]
MQSQTNDVIINDRPKFLTACPNDDDHCILAPSEDPDNVTRLPLCIHGTISYLHVRKPTATKYTNCEHVSLTADAPDWDPRTTKYRLVEDSLVDNAGRLLERGDLKDRHFISLLYSELSTNNQGIISKQLPKEELGLYCTHP